MAIALGVFEILNRVNDAKTKDEKIGILRQYDNPTIRRLVRYAYDDRIRWILPDGDPPYKPLPKHEQVGSEQMLHKEARTMYLFLEGDDDANPNVTMRRREQKFIELLENVHPDDARVILEVKRRSLPHVSADLARAAFPGLLPEKTSVAVVRTMASDALEHIRARKRAWARKRRAEIREKKKRERENANI